MIYYQYLSSDIIKKLQFVNKHKLLYFIHYIQLVYYNFIIDYKF